MIKAPIQFTKIIATVGPASSSSEMLEKLIVEGVNMFRLNFSHGTHEDHALVIKRIIAINEKCNTHIGIIADLQGPKLRIGDVIEGGIPLKKGDVVPFLNKPLLGTKEGVYMSYEQFAADVNQGDKVMVDDGKLIFEVVSTNKIDRVDLLCTNDGVLSSKKGVNLPDTNISLPSLTTKDLIDLEFMLTQPINWIALSFVRNAKDVKALKKLIHAKNHPAKVISKIEKPSAVDKIDSIIKASNAIMIARGDLGVEVAMEKLPSIQKMIIKKCIQRARPVIVATQMMDSMITNPSPTRAEVTDVANAVLDGTDAVMLSGETSVGKYPVEVIKAMSKIVGEAEKHFHMTDKKPKPAVKSGTFMSDAICYHASNIANELKAKGIVGLTVSGYTAFKTSSFRPKCPIYIFSEKKDLLAALNLVRGVRSFYYDSFSNTDQTIIDVNNILKDHNLAHSGDTIINMASMPMKLRLRTNTLKVTILD